MAAANVRSEGVERTYSTPLVAGEGQHIETEVVRSHDPDDVADFFRHNFTLISSASGAGELQTDYTFQRIVENAPPSDIKPAGDFERFLAAAVKEHSGKWRTVRNVGPNAARRIMIGWVAPLWLSLDATGRVYAWDGKTKTTIAFDTRLEFTALYKQVSAAANVILAKTGEKPRIDLPPLDKYAALRGKPFNEFEFSEKMKLAWGPAKRALRAALASGEIKRYDAKTYVIATPPPDEASDETTVDETPPADLVSPRRMGSAPPPTKTPRDPLARIPNPAPKWFIIYRQEIEAELTRAQRRVEELESAIMEHEHEQTRALTVISDPKQALESMIQQVAISPKFKDLTHAEHEYVARVALLSRLNPEFHIHAWIQDDWDNKKKETVRTLHIMPDYKALIACATDPIMVKERRLTADEMRDRGISEQDIKEGAIAYMVEGYNLNHALKARTAGLTYEPFKGYGWWAAMKDKDEWKENAQGKSYKTGNKTRVQNDTPNGRDGEWTAKKRAIRDLFNQVADLRPVLDGMPGIREDDGELLINAGNAPQLDNVVYGELVDTRAAWLKIPEQVEKADAWKESLGVTDEEINAEVDSEDWKQSQLEGDEFKAIVERIHLRKASSAPAVTDESDDAS